MAVNSFSIRSLNYGSSSYIYVSKCSRLYISYIASANYELFGDINLLYVSNSSLNTDVIFARAFAKNASRSRNIDYSYKGYTSFANTWSVWASQPKDGSNNTYSWRSLNIFFTSVCSSRVRSSKNYNVSYIDLLILKWNSTASFFFTSIDYGSLNA